MMSGFRWCSTIKSLVASIACATTRSPTLRLPRWRGNSPRKKHVDVYGIYFHFSSDRLRPESAPVLEKIGAILQKNPDWKLNITGHTDNIGGDASNLELSRKRAAAVKTALVGRFHIVPARLTTGGMGASQPQAGNDTPEGRARNRRVELTRQ
jgi:outer membrane protein OmpA-like peptidoglycan-associated protein